MNLSQNTCLASMFSVTLGVHSSREKGIDGLCSVEFSCGVY